MQVFICCPDFGFSSVSFTADSDSLVADVVKTVAEEWNINKEEIELSFEGEILRTEVRLLSHVTRSEAELVAFKKTWLFGKRWFNDAEQISEMLVRHSNSGDEFLCLDTPTFVKYNKLNLVRTRIHKNMTAIAFRNSNSDVQIIKRDFFSLYKFITSLDLSSLSSVTTIEENFLLGCSSLNNINLSGLSSVSTIEGSFLRGCTSLRDVDLSGFSNVTTVGYCFVEGCTSLTTINLSNLSNVTKVGFCFLSQCTSITTLNLSDFSSLDYIEMGFLLNCTSLKTIDVSGFQNVSTIGACFLQGCSFITTLDLSNFYNVEVVGANFLDGCRLTSIQLPQRNLHLFEEYECVRRIRRVKKEKSSCVVS